MGKTPKFFLVQADALPEVFLKVAEAKRTLETGEAATVNDATQMAGVSRSAFYKYKDALTPFFEMSAGKIISFQMTLKDEPGILSSILGIFADLGANILTINQSIPVNGCAAVTITVETSDMQEQLSALVDKAGAAEGVVRFEISAG